MRNWLRNDGSVLESSPVLAAMIIATCAVVVVHMMFHVPVLGAQGVIVDFDAFYIVGRMAWNGDVTGAYSIETMRQAQQHMSGSESFMPWTYPPQFDLLAAALPLLPRGLSYGLFMAATLGAWLIVVKALSERNFTAVLLATAPAVIVGLRIGQNGFLTGALVGWFCLLVLGKRNTLAGLPLGLMVIKPHLGLGLGILALIQGRWAMLGVALTVATVSSLLATLVFGTKVWGAFHTGVGEAAEFLAQGLYPLFRMTTLYAALHRLGVEPEVAMAAQALLAVVALSCIAVAARCAGMRLALAVACLLTLMISPYTYDYDMPIFGVGLALVVRDVIKHCTPFQRFLLLGLAWASCGWGLILAQQTDGMPSAAREQFLDAVPSIGGITYPLMLAMALWFCRKRCADHTLAA